VTEKTFGLIQNQISLYVLWASLALTRGCVLDEYCILAESTDFCRWWSQGVVVIPFARYVFLSLLGRCMEKGNRLALTSRPQDNMYQQLWEEHEYR
jgi:hypothetical protein